MGKVENLCAAPVKALRTLGVQGISRWGECRDAEAEETSRAGPARSHPALAPRDRAPYLRGRHALQTPSSLMTTHPVSSLLLGAFCAWLGACATTTTKRLGLSDLPTVPQVDLERYLGEWYEIAAFPQRFQRGCTATTATYAWLDATTIEVVNRCRNERPDGELRTATGRARVVDPATNAKLEVSFFRPFWGAYWIVDLGDDYEYAVVGHPSRDYLWILARSASLEAPVYEEIVARLEQVGYETERLVRTIH
jgi:apolipoprotein D and lipocalin family protein